MHLENEDFYTNPKNNDSHVGVQYDNVIEKIWMSFVYEVGKWVCIVQRHEQNIK